MKIKLLSLYLLFSFCSLLFPDIIEVSQDGTGDYTTIQEGINMSCHSDTVIVHPGTYFETLEVFFKAITIGSLFLTTGDDSYVSQTIIDGKHDSSVIYLKLTSQNGDNKISGFTIQNGIGVFPPYTTSIRLGGGIYSYFSNLTVDNCIFQYNDVYGHGGGLCAEESEIFINDCIFQYNTVNESGGGIAILDSYLNLSSSTIKYNTCGEKAGGLIIGSSIVNFDNENLNNIYMNYAGCGSDIFISVSCPFQEIILDTFTVIDPDDEYYFIYPGSGGAGIPMPDHFSVDIQHGYVDQVDQDLYVSPNGNNNNSGISPTDPLQTLSYALMKIKSDNLNQRTIYIEDGVYTHSQNNQVFPMQIKSYVDITGESMENTILDAEYTKGFFIGSSGQKNCSIDNLTLLHHNYGADVSLDGCRKIHLNNLYVSENQYAKSMVLEFSDVSFENITIENCLRGDLYYYGTKDTEVIDMNNCIFRNNQTATPVRVIRATQELDVFNIVNTEITDNVGTITEWLPTCSGLLVSCYLNVNIVNSTIGNNYSISNGASVSLENGVDVNILNSIIYGNNPYNLFLDGRMGSIDLFTNNSLIGGGIDGQLDYGNNNVNWDDETMLDENPLWVIFNNSYALSEDSPCIDSGTLDFPPGVEIPAYDLAGNPRVMGRNIDMGAYEFPGNAAPIYLQVDNETLSWQLPEFHYPYEYNIYLDDIYRSTQSSDIFSYTFTNLVIDQTYKAGVSAVYNEEETAIIPHYFTYQPISSEDPLIPNPESQIPSLSNYPNPFNPETTISFNVKQTSSFVNLTIYNMKGQKIKQLVRNQVTAGQHSVVWDGTDVNNKRVASGIYLFKLNVNGNTIKAKKMLLLK